MIKCRRPIGLRKSASQNISPAKINPDGVAFTELLFSRPTWLVCRQTADVVSAVISDGSAWIYGASGSEVAQSFASQKLCGSSSKPGSLLGRKQYSVDP
jgi:hypothetical protein